MNALLGNKKHSSRGALSETSLPRSTEKFATALVMSITAFLTACETSVNAPPQIAVESAGNENQLSPRLLPTVFVDELNPNSACGARRQNEGGDDRPGHTCLEILFATNRAFSSPGAAAINLTAAYPENPDEYFSDTRFSPAIAANASGYFRTAAFDAGEVFTNESYSGGRVIVTVPRRQPGVAISAYDYDGNVVDKIREALGVAERSVSDEDRAQFFTTFNYETMSQNKFWNRADFLLNVGARSRVSEWSNDTRSALVFVHGFNVSFSRAAYRTAQIVYDLKYAGAPFMFSWPANSQNDPLRYFNDISEAAGATGDLKLFLLDIKKKLNPSKFIIIAHSHGNQLLLRTLNEIAAETRGSEPLFDAVVFASPDVDAFEFRRLVERTSDLSRAKILYTSNDDRANLARQILTGVRANIFTDIEVKPRAGFVKRGEEPVLARGLQSIDLTGASVGRLGPEENTKRAPGWKRRDKVHHDQYVSSSDIVADLRALIAKPVDADNTPILPHCRSARLQQRIAASGQQYWRFESTAAPSPSHPECAATN